MTGDWRERLLQSERCKDISDPGGGQSISYKPTLAPEWESVFVTDGKA